jgi:rubrerythrin
MLNPIQQKVLTGVFRQIVNNSRLHVFILKNYHFIEEFGAGQLTKVERLLTDSDLKEKIAQHIADEAKHAALFRQRIIELGASPTLTPDEFEVAFFSRFDTYGLGISEARLIRAIGIAIRRNGANKDGEQEEHPQQKTSQDVERLSPAALRASAERKVYA